MFDIGFSEVLLIFVIALIVLGPEKLPRAASQVGRWIGRARAMARQFKDQLEEEVNLENVRKAHKEAAAKEEAASKDAAANGGATGAGVGAAGDSTAGVEPGASSAAGDAQHGGAQANAASAPTTNGATYSGPDPVDFRADTFSHAHPTNEYGANPHTANGGPPEESPPPAAEPTTETVTTLATPLPTSEPVREPAAGVTPTQQPDNHSHS